ncbi:hypothetical protein HMPREF9194_02158 [Treponema maltophilum ATCC 51939]|uniref:Uncharacterized protein n=1 Tax=Treponema maltophilum ATCC 51939 TaxID=1125699 RepID=S3K0N8_TREMA|nr:hypothetical protein HMPREF9194_02158 [Treponema maltophilum ATCC 51939]
MQKLGKHPLSTESGATHTEMALRMQVDKRYSESMDSIIGGSDIWCEWNTSMDITQR